jgi:glutathione S-transferase
MKLFYSPGACSLASHIILEELQQPYEVAKVDLKAHRVDSEDYYKINPQGAVPALRLDDGSLLTQNSAILLYLADLAPQQQLIPKVGTRERIRAQEWLAFITADLHKLFAPLFSSERFVSSQDSQAELKSNAIKSIQQAMNIVEHKLKDRDLYAMGEHFSVVDAYLFVMYLWMKHFHIVTNTWPNFSKIMQRVAERPSVQRVLSDEGLVQTESK